MSSDKLDKFDEILNVSERVKILTLKNKEDQDSFKIRIKKNYPIHMVYDKDIHSKNHMLPDLKSYRSNFLSGEIII